MAIQWADDFGRYGTSGGTAAMLNGLPYANLGGSVENSPDPNDTGRAFRINSAINEWPLDMRIALPTVVSGTIGIAARVWLSNLPGDNNQRPAVVGFQRADGTYIVYARVEQNGAITIQGRVSGVESQRFNSVNPIIQPSSFNHYELVHNRATGEGSLYINGVLRATYTGVDTADNIAFTNMSNRSASISSIGMWVKDLVIWDSTGTQNNTVIGTVIVRRLKPNSDDTLGGWIPSTGTTGFNLLAKDAVNDSTFITGDILPTPASQFNMENLPADVTSVRALIPVVRARKVDGGDASLQLGLTPNGTNYDNGPVSPTTPAYTYYYDVSELNPATGAAWTPVSVDSVRLRVNRTV